MMEEYLVSIIIPTYKRPIFLERAIDSAVNQTYSNIEIIVVSDNDINSEYEKQTTNIVKKFVEREKIIYLPAIGNQGGCSARNRGLRVAKGKYINFLDDDDVILPEKIQLQIDILKSNGGSIAVVGCCAAIRNSKGRIYRIERPRFDPKDVLFSELKCNICTTSINLINADVCRKAGGFHYIESSQEHLFLIAVFTVNPSFRYVDKVLVEINQHNGTRVSNNIKRPIGTLKLTKIIEERYYPLYDESHIKILKLARLEADILAYCMLGDFTKAKEFLYDRCKLKTFDLDNLKIVIKIIMYILKRGRDVYK